MSQTKSLLTDADRRELIKRQAAEIAQLQEKLGYAAIGDNHHHEEYARLEAENARLRAALKKACDLLAERTYGNAARSPGHNARLVLESALGADEQTADGG